MRNIEFKANVNGMVKIFVDGRELGTALDTKALRTFRAQKRNLPPVMGQNLVDAVVKKLNDDVINLAKDEVNFIIARVKDELGV